MSSAQQQQMVQWYMNSAAQSNPSVSSSNPTGPSFVTSGPGASSNSLSSPDLDVYAFDTASFLASSFAPPMMSGASSNATNTYSSTIPNSFLNTDGSNFPYPPYSNS
jgi:hypothetical protein